MHSPHIRFLNSITVTVTDSPVLIFKTGDHITLTFHDHIRNRMEVPIIWGTTEHHGRTETGKPGSPVVWRMYTVWV